MSCRCVWLYVWPLTARVAVKQPFPAPPPTPKMCSVQLCVVLRLRGICRVSMAGVLACGPAHGRLALPPERGVNCVCACRAVCVRLCVSVCMAGVPVVDVVCSLRADGECACVCPLLLHRASAGRCCNSRQEVAFGWPCCPQARALRTRAFMRCHQRRSRRVSSLSAGRLTGVRPISDHDRFPRAATTSK
jgi:hypothetical protein